MASDPEYPEWQPAIARIVATGGFVLVIGLPDTGKTTFCRYAANAALAQGRSVALIDADTGQSEVGPPACVSLALPDAPVQRLSDLQPIATAFVGSITPRYGTIEHLAAVCRIATIARAHNPDIILCDTTGFMRGLTAQRLKRAKTVALRPDHVVRLSSRPFASPADARPTHPEVHTLGVPAAITAKPPALRAQRREARFEHAFAGAVDRSYPLDDVRLEATWLGSGRPLTAAALQQLSRALRVSVKYGETSAGHLGIIVGTLPGPDTGLAAARELYGVSDVSVTLESNLGQLVVGLHDAKGQFLGLGRVTVFDCAGRVLHVATSTHSHGIVRTICFGLIRVSAMGQTLDMLKPGDV